jgi:hypothetical protein
MCSKRCGKDRNILSRIAACTSSKQTCGQFIFYDSKEYSLNQLVTNSFQSWPDLLRPPDVASSDPPDKSLSAAAGATTTRERFWSPRIGFRHRKQSGHLDPKHLRDPLQQIDRRVRDSTFDPACVGPVDAGFGRESLRRNPSKDPNSPDIPGDQFSGVHIHNRSH